VPLLIRMPQMPQPGQSTAALTELVNPRNARRRILRLS
jgi:hypothetical protein